MLDEQTGNVMQAYGQRICLYRNGTSISLRRQHRTSDYAGRTASVGSRFAGGSITQSIETRSRSSRLAMGGFSLLSVALIIMASAGAVIALPLPDLDQSETLLNVPQVLSGECSAPKDCVKPRIQRPRSKKAESCTVRCVTTCIRGGEGSPGEGPLNIRRPLVVFKEGFRSRRYCLVECSDICNLIGEQLGGEP